MKTLLPFARLGLASALLAALAGCGGGGGGSADGGTLTLAVTDAAVDAAEHVYVQFSGLEIQPAEGDRITIDYAAPKTIDLLALQGGQRALLLEDYALAPGAYSWIRLKVNAEADGTYDSYIVIDGAQYELRIPSGSETGLKLNTTFTIVEDAESDFTIDFDLRQSVHAPGGQTGPGGAPAYLLRPTLRIVDSSEAGSIGGTLAAGVFGELACSAPQLGYAVYVYAGAGVTPDDVDGKAPEPIGSAKVTVNPGGAYAYTLAFLAPGAYTIAATCQGDLDDPDSDDDIEFVGATTVSVTVGGSVQHDFGP